jgi:hypothetical protein
MGTIGQVDHGSTPLWRHLGQHFLYASAEGQSLSALVILLPPLLSSPGVRKRALPDGGMDDFGEA